MDGTLIDSEHLWLQGEQKIMHEMGGIWGPEDQAHCLGGPIERAVDYMIAKSNSDSSQTEIVDRLLVVMGRLYQHSPLRWCPGARELLVEALDQQIPTALVTASWRRIIDVVHEAINLDLGREAFTVTIGGDEVQTTKPHPEPYITAAHRLGIAPHQCLALEDSPPGAASAHAAGCRVVAIPHITAIASQPHLALVDSLVGHDLASLWSLTY
jgi:beta-phosphoglucomutase-like phosphatase (HAD superfamily)